MLSTLARSRHLCPGMESHFACCYEGRLSQELAASGAPVYTLGGVRISRPWTVWQARARLRKLLSNQHFDVVICHMGWSLAVFGAAVRACGHKVVVWMHGLQGGFNWLGWLAQRANPDLAIANSRFTSGEIRNQFPHASVQVIHCPVSLDRAGDEDRSRTALRQQQGAGEGTAVILQVSRVEACKGHLLHLEALSRIKTLSSWVCWMVGGPQTSKEAEYFLELQRTARALGIEDRVKFLGQRSDVPKLLAAADIFCQPNVTPEGFGLVFIEALWAGRPVVTTAMGGALEIIDDTCGILTKPADAEDLAESLRKLMESPELRTRLGQAGPGRALHLCDPASQMEKLRDVLRTEAGGAVSSRRAGLVEHSQAAAK